MRASDVVTLLPTALSAALYATTQLTFFHAMSTRSAPELPARPPSVSVLVPVAGRDGELTDNLSAFAEIDYPDYELLIGVASRSDPAVPVVEAFLASRPGLAARLVVTSPPRGALANPKVAQLIYLARAARGSVLVISDANIRVSPGYLRSLVSALSRPGVGLVSSVVVGGGARSLGAAIDGAQLGAYVAPSVVTAHALGLWPITVGKSMAMRKADLETIGGFESVAGVLAEDDVLGQRFHAHGFGVDLSLDPVENRNGGTSWQGMIDRHTRWAMIRRSVTPLGFAFELMLSPLIVALCAAVISPSRLSLSAIAFALLLSWTGALAALTRARARGALFLAAIEPLRAVTMFLCWCLGWVNRRVVWHGNAFTLDAGSRLTPARAAEPAIHG